MGGSYYHIFNRGSNRKTIFFTTANYHYFLKLLNKFLGSYVHFLAFALLPNHFHLVIKIKDEILVQAEGNRSLQKENGFLQSINDETAIGKMVAKQLKRLFITYAMAINKQENRTGNLFDPKYKRLEISDQKYLEYVIFYTHFNPEKHGTVNNYKDYYFSSFKAMVSFETTNIDREMVMEIYGGKDNFLNYHIGWHEERSEIILE